MGGLRGINRRWTRMDADVMESDPNGQKCQHGREESLMASRRRIATNLFART